MTDKVSNSSFANQLYSPRIEYARGIAALSVLLFHTYIWVMFPNTIHFFDAGSLEAIKNSNLLDKALFFTLSFGFLGVNLFFVLSGFCIHISNAAKNADIINLTKFFKKRFARLYPLYFIVFTALFILYGPILGRYDEKGVNVLNYISHAFFWHYNGSSAQSGMGISAVLWTIAIEVQFYVLYAILYPYLRKIGFFNAALFFILLEIIYRIIFPIISNIIEIHPYFSPARFPLMRFGEWLLGAWLAEKYVNNQLGKYRPSALFFSGLGLIVAFIIIGKSLNWDKYASTDVSSAIGFTLILAAFLCKENIKNSNQNGIIAKLLNWLGTRCYSLYLTHATMVLIVAEICDKIGAGLEIRLAASLGTIIISAIAADIAYRLIEYPSHKFAKRL